MACRGFFECLLKLLNFLLAVIGLSMIGYGIYLFVEYKRGVDHSVTFTPTNGKESNISLGRPMLIAVALTSNAIDNLPKAWFIYLFIGIGVCLCVVSFCGCVGVWSRNRCCLSCYSMFLIFLILVELGFAAFIFFDKSWKDDIPADGTGNFVSIYNFLKENWKIIKWVALGAVILEALLFFLALMVKAVNAPADYDSDDELIAHGQQSRQPFLNHQPVTATNASVAPASDQRSNRNDAWNKRMREQYGLDPSEFTNNPSESHRFQKMPTQPNEERKQCIIM